MANASCPCSRAGAGLTERPPSHDPWATVGPPYPAVKGGTAVRPGMFRWRGENVRRDCTRPRAPARAAFLSYISPGGVCCAAYPHPRACIPRRPGAVYSPPRAEPCGSSGEDGHRVLDGIDDLSDVKRLSEEAVERGVRAA